MKAKCNSYFTLLIVGVCESSMYFVVAALVAQVLLLLFFDL